MVAKTAENVQVHAIHCGGDLTDWAVFDPFDERAGTKVYNPYFVYVIRHPAGTVLFDTGAHPDLATNPAARLGDTAQGLAFRIAPEDRLDHRLAQTGLRVQDIDVVVQSHLHFDHTGGLDLFPDTPVMVQSTELAFAQEPPIYQREFFVAADFARATHWHELNGDHDIFGDGRLLLLSTPGHTPGHQSLMVQLAARVVVLLGDATYLLDKMRARRLPAITWNPDAQIATWHRIEQLEREHDAFLIATHDLDYEQRIRLAPTAWYE